MIQWPSISAGGQAGKAPEPVALPIDRTSAASGFGIDFAQLASIGESATEASPVVAAHGEEKAAAPARSRWTAAALTASVIFHAVAIAGFGVLVAPEGLEAQTDAISVEIVLESAPQTATEASVAGDANETRDAAAPADRPEPGTRAADRPLDTPETAVEQTVTPRSFESASAVLLPGFEPLPPLTDIGTAREQEVAVAPAEPTPDPKVDVAATLPYFSPLPPLVGTPDATVPPNETAETHDTPEPVLAVRPSLESMLPAVAMPEPPLFRPAAPAKVAPAEKKVAKRDKTPERTKAGKPETKPTARARAEKPERPKAGEKASPPGGAKAKGKSQEATRAGSVASAAASSGDKEAYGRKVNSHVQRYKRYPEAAARGGMKGAVKVSISIGGSGNLASARVTGSSGYPVLDGEALATVRRAAPYPKPPAGFTGTARFSLTLRYSK